MKWLFVLLLSPAVFAGLPATMRLDVTLEDAVWANPTNRLPVRVKLERDHGAWQQLVSADSRRMHQGDHWGALMSEKLGDDGGAFAVALRIEPDPWAKTSGYASYKVTLRRDGEAFAGSWEGEFNGTPVKGAARAVVRPVVETTASFVRPHLLIRAEELPALKAKAQTEWGKAWLARVAALAKSDPDQSRRAVACGFLYQLTGDKAQAAEARRLIEQDVPNWNNVMYVHGAAAGVLQGALAFDLIAETCDTAFRQRMREVFRRKCDYLYYPPVGGFNPNDASNWSAMYRSALGLAALSVLAEAGPMNIEVVAEQVFEPKPSQENVRRVVPLEPGKSIAEWDYAGPVPVPFGAGAVNVDCGAFTPLDRKHFISAEQADKYRNPKLLGGVDFASVTGRRYFTANQLAIMLKVETAGLYQLEVSDRKMEQLVVWLDGHRLNNGDVVRLAPGLYPLKVLASIGVVGNWELVEWYLRFNAVTEAEATAWGWERQQATSLAAVLRERLPGVDPDALRWLGIARQRIANWSETALGDHGWNMEGEAYTQHALRCVLPFERAYRNAQSRSLFPNERVAALYPLCTAKTVFGTDRVTMPGYGPGGGPLGVDNWARGFFLVRPAERAAMLWVWNRTLALADAGKFTMTEGLVDKFDALSAVCHFIDYPAELKETNPAAVLPRVVVDQQKGGYVFRNRWQDGDDFVTTIFLDSDPDDGGWRAPDWADFRIVGLGIEWAVRGIAWGNGASARKLPNPRLHGNVVFVPEAWQRGKRGAQTTKFESAPDGSGIVTANLDDVYLGSANKVTGTRSFAVDYSGKSGAPCLVAVADQVTGSAGSNTWQFCTLPEHKVTVTADGFTIVAGNGASTVARVIQPAAAKITVQPVTIKHEINYHGRHSQADFKRQVINVAGRDTFFVVLTVQPGKAPAVKSVGDKVTVGGLTLRYDGAQIDLSR